MRKNPIAIILGTTGALLVATGIYAQTKMYPEKEAINKARAPVPVAGAPADTLSTGSSDASTQLNQDSVYAIICEEDVHVRWCDTSTCTAVGTDLFLPARAYFFFATGHGGETPNARYVAAIKDVTADTCYINEVR